ncbi:MAG: hypothetical protein M1814_002582 [Vezdaea aestivalis]|nr:MAG: hypothetical protein M1814_002582 [Vezdaea aestivalis]
MFFTTPSHLTKQAFIPLQGSSSNPSPQRTAVEETSPREKMEEANHSQGSKYISPKIPNSGRSGSNSRQSLLSPLSPAFKPAQNASSRAIVQPAGFPLLSETAWVKATSPMGQLFWKRGVLPISDGRVKGGFLAQLSEMEWEETRTRSKGKGRAFTEEGSSCKGFGKVENDKRTIEQTDPGKGKETEKEMMKGEGTGKEKEGEAEWELVHKPEVGEEPMEISRLTVKQSEKIGKKAWKDEKEIKYGWVPVSKQWDL